MLLFLSLFLNSRLAFWVAFGLPVSFLGMFIFAPLFGVTVNILSTFGMIIVIGILVDDGIVIAENIYQQYEKGKSPYRAAIDGVLEVIPPVVSAIITTVLAFSLFLFLDSRIGEFFGEVSVVVILTLVISLIEALIILPAHLANSKALVLKKKKPKTLIAKGFSKLFQKNIKLLLLEFIFSDFVRLPLKGVFFDILLIPLEFTALLLLFRYKDSVIFILFFNKLLTEFLLVLLLLLLLMEFL